MVNRCEEWQTVEDTIPTVREPSSLSETGRPLDFKYLSLLLCSCVNVFIKRDFEAAHTFQDLEHEP